MARKASLSGFPEWLPAERVVEQHVLDTLRRVFELHGFANIETRAVETRAQLLRKGEIDKEVYGLSRLAADPEEEKKFGAKKLESNPEAVTTTSSVRQVWEPDSHEEAAEKPVREGIQHDLVRKSCPSTEIPMEEYP